MTLGTSLRRQIATPPDTEHPVRLDVLALALRQRRASGQLRHRRGVRESERDHGGPDALAEDRDDEHGEEQAREGDEGIGRAGDDCVDPTALPRGEDAERRPERERETEDQQRADQAGTSSVHDPGRDVLPGLVGAEPVVAADALQRRGQVGLGRVVRCDPRREHGAADHDGEEHRRHPEHHSAA
ncbi:hypothetical protein L0C25_02510 [Solicola gregarius]|uniref:Uncharacterized protein n=1 Tax=Solicola gregarius TaxID=2908642 RepID=A0AA46YKY5_9ACTN|nr:hypothetical protein [Solicola gregarius]UYM05967.1 hypothetical protein L0C25_02510 [Solicola gregarius]